MRYTFRSWMKFGLAGLLAAALCGCKEQLQSRVGERDANEMLATLYAAGIAASKVARDDKNWAVEVERDDQQRALAILRDHGLPRETFANTGELFKKEGLVSTPTEERIRFMYAVSQELARTLSEIDGVISARVHLVMPANDPLASRVRPSSASVFIKHRSNADLQAMSPAIKNLVMRGIEGLGYENIALTFVPGESTPLAAAPPVTAASPYPGAVTALGIALLAGSALALAGASGYGWGRRRMRRAAAAQKARNTLPSGVALASGRPEEAAPADEGATDAARTGAFWARFGRARRARPQAATTPAPHAADEASFSADLAVARKAA